MPELPTLELPASEKDGVYIKYLPQSQLARALNVCHQQQITPLLLIEHFQQNPTISENSQQSSLQQAFIHLNSGLDSIDENQCELWVGRGHWEQDQIDLPGNVKLSFSCNQDFLIGSLSIQLNSDSPLQSLSQLYYEQIIDFITAQNKPHLLRMWNYFPDINQIDDSSGDSLERYQKFCIGRHNAFASSTKKEFEYPAASAVGSCSESHSAKMVIIFIATHEPGQFLENPDQISAYQYPSHYSPKSPSFARASIYQTGNLHQLHISGTASIVGHESKFHGDIINQTHQTIKNLKRLIQYSNEDFAAETFSLMNSSVDAAIIKVYLRNPDDKKKVAPIIQAFSPYSQYICYLQADICRQELDIEIEMLLSSILS